VSSGFRILHAQTKRGGGSKFLQQKNESNIRARKKTNLRPHPVVVNLLARALFDVGESLPKLVRVRPVEENPSR